MVLRSGDLFDSRRDHRSRCPIDLQVSALHGRRVLVVGSTLAEATSHFVHRVLPGAQVEYVRTNCDMDLEAKTASELAQFDFQLVFPPLRPLISETALFRQAFNDDDGQRRALDEAFARLETMLDVALAYRHLYSLPTVLCGLLVPQQNRNGKLLPRFDAGNPVYVVERLNERIARRADCRKSLFYLDLDAIAATIGKRHVLDDAVWVTGHGAFANDWDHPWDAAGKHAPVPLSESVELKSNDFRDAIWREADAIVRSALRIDRVEAVVLDLDDTLWRGVASEGTVHPGLEGWPLGMLEAILTVTRRGIRLALSTGIERGLLERVWPAVFGTRLSLDDFAVAAIGGHCGIERMHRILSALDLAPSAVVFVHRDPLERESISAAFHGVRTLGADHYFTRSALLWAPETQGPPSTTGIRRKIDAVPRGRDAQAAGPERATSYASVFSLGGYCQVTHQLKAHAVAYTHSPFDWLVTPFDAIRRIIEDRGARFGLALRPSDDELTALCDTYDVMHAHDLPHDGCSRVLITPKTKATMRAKFQRKCEVFFSALCGPGHKLLIRAGGHASPPVAWPFVRDREATRVSDLVRLAQMLDAVGCRDFDLLFVTFDGLTDVVEDVELPSNILLRRLPIPAVATWQGCSTGWTDIFAGLPRPLPRLPQADLVEAGRADRTMYGLRWNLMRA